MSKPGAAQFPTTFRAAPSRVATKTEARDGDQDRAKEVWARKAALCKRHDGCGMVGDRGLLPLLNKRGRPRTTPLREVVNALFYMAQTGCQWRMLPKEFPPYTAVQRYF